MPTGVEIVIEDGFATVTPDPEQRGHVLRSLLAAVDHPSQVRTDTSGRRRSYVVLEQDARKAGLLDEKAPANKSEPKAVEPVKAAPKRAPAKKAPAKSDDEAWQ